MNATDSPRIYVACLASYNAGILYGRWIDADQDADAIRAEVQEMLAGSSQPGAEEWAIHDYDSFGSLNLGEWESFERIAEIAAGIAEHGEPFLAWLSNDSSVDVDDFTDAYAGTWDSEKDFAYNYVDECGWGGLETIPDGLSSYIDWDAITRDLFMDYTAVKLSDYTVAVFHDNY